MPCILVLIKGDIHMILIIPAFSQTFFCGWITKPWISWVRTFSMINLPKFNHSLEKSAIFEVYHCLESHVVHISFHNQTLKILSVANDNQTTQIDVCILYNWIYQSCWCKWDQDWLDLIWFLYRNSKLIESKVISSWKKNHPWL